MVWLDRLPAIPKSGRNETRCPIHTRKVLCLAFHLPTTLLPGAANLSKGSPPVNSGVLVKPTFKERFLLYPVSQGQPKMDSLAAGGEVPTGRLPVPYEGETRSYSAFLSF